MPHLHDIYRRLQSIADVSVDQAMAAALPTADPEAVRLIVQSLLSRQKPEGLTSLVRYFDQLPYDIQEEIVRRAPTWDQPLREVAARRNPSGPANVIRIVVLAKACHLAYLMTEQLRHRPPDLRQIAGEGILELTRWATAEIEGCRTSCTPAAARHIQSSVDEAFRLYGAHQQPSVLLAVAQLAPHPMPASVRQMTIERDPAAVAALRREFASAQQAEYRRAMLILIKIPALAKWVMQGIGVASCEGHLTEVLSYWHLLINQGVVHSLQPIANPHWLWPDERELPRWPAEVAVGLAHWVSALPLSDQQRAQLLTRLTLVPDALSRLCALRKLIAMSGSSDADPAVLQAISRFCSDPKEKVAWIALRHLVANRWQGLTAMLPRLVSSHHQEVAQLAQKLLAPLGFQRLWDGWQRMAYDNRLALGRALMKIDPRWQNQLASKLTSPARLDVLRALSIVHGLNQGNQFHAILLKLAQHDDVKIVSAAVRVLGSVQSPPASDVLEASLQHDDARVRANAVEAIQQLNSTRHIKQISRMTKDEHSRPRANAIKALMRMSTGDALAALAEMLHDPKPDHRISALWVVEAMGLLDVTRQVAEISITDPDAQVKERADHVVHNLMRTMNAPIDDHRTRSKPSWTASVDGKDIA